jgi:SAM-dependent methyltransferase
MTDGGGTGDLGRAAESSVPAALSGADRTHESVAANRRLWDGWTDMHIGPGSTYDVESFIADPHARPLDSVIRELVGDVHGKRLLHLQCHFGMDTLRLVLMGARATGIDFSPRAIAEARELSARTGIPAIFVESDVRSLPDIVPPGGLDIVFTSYGVISWLPELTSWAETIASRLAPGGVFLIAESHPSLWVWDEELPEPPLTVRYSYFHDAKPLILSEKGSYAVPDGEFEAESHSWQHNFADIFGALLGAGLTIEWLREYPKVAWQHFPFMVKDDEGLWRLPADMPEIPLLFALRARKPR